jgi:uncharacterized membrane protein
MKGQLNRLIPFGYRQRSPRASRFNQVLPWIGGIGLGSIAMALLDPVAGRRRRARLRDGVTHALNNTGNAIGTTTRDLSHRTRGLAARTISVFNKKDVPDEVLVERVRSRIGRLISHPHAIEVHADQECVTLAGPVLLREVDRLLRGVSKVPGVRSVENRLEVHKRAENVPSLQGGKGWTGAQFELMQVNWSPATRLLSALTGGSLLAYGLRRRDWTGAALGMIGVGLFARGATNIEMKRLIGVGGGRRAVDFQKTINIQAPVNVVYDFWTKLENFPRFMSRVRWVVDKGNGVSHWVMAGPVGVEVEWSAVITEQIPNRVLAWKSLPGTAIDNAGLIRFDPNPDGGTRVNIRLSYNPPLGAIGHAAAALFGADPDRVMDEDLMRMKNLIEGANPPRDAAQRIDSASR